MKIPDHAERVFKGIIYDIYHWEQEMFDGSTRTFEALKRLDSACVMAMQGETVFYAKQTQPGRSSYLSLFGGNGEEGEDVLDTGKRELLEESGMVSDNWKLLNRHEVFGKIDWAICLFIAYDCKKVAEQNLDCGEKVEVCSCSIDDFLTEIVTAANFYEFELKQEIISKPNPEAVARVKEQILSGIK